MKSNYFKTLVILIASVFMTACSNDDDLGLDVTPEYLEATTWDAQMSGITTPNPYSDHFVMQFLTKKNGKCIEAYGDTDHSGSFTYQITKNMILFNGSITGYWTIVEHTKSQMVLQSFQPYEFKLVLTKM